eukprot:NODE_11168_length_1303_cov_6.784864.p1 GENE.NODE_11168_length_1303_cov_6.784864~~NODE_11168_length_1303_cov_6.784864.p1  ORF type:complete len:356 (+),score=50.25 NODE_11168_length_1303_cov_6.784864:146-1213(+)
MAPSTCPPPMKRETVREGTIYKRTRICVYYESGTCRHGSNCTYAHGREELQPQTNLSCTKFCRAMQLKGECSDPNCRYAHTKKERRRLPSSIRWRVPQRAADTDRHDAADSAATAAVGWSMPPRAGQSRHRMSTKARLGSDRPQSDNAGLPKPPSSLCELTHATTGFSVPCAAPQRPPAAATFPDGFQVMLMQQYQQQMCAQQQLHQQCAEGTLNAKRMEVPCDDAWLALADFTAIGATGQPQYCHEQHSKKVGFWTAAAAAPGANAHSSTARRQCSVATGATECPEEVQLESVCRSPSAGPHSPPPEWRIDSDAAVDDDEDEWDTGGYCIRIKNTFLTVELERSPSASRRAHSV